MMGQSAPPQSDLFVHGFSLEARVRRDHPLRQVEAMVDFDFVAAEVEHLYGGTGRESIPPPTILKLMFLLFFYNVRSERELMATLPAQIDWLWFLGFAINTPIPDHSVLSKARRRWGVDAFRRFFERVVQQCCDEGLLEGGTVFCDSSLVDANASVDSIVTAACIRLDDQTDAAGAGEAKGYSTSDLDAAVVSKRGSGPARPRYKTHRAVDGSGVVTSTMVTPGDVNEGSLLSELIDQHEANTGDVVRTAVADSQYGSTENLLACSDRGIQPHMNVRGQMRNIAAERGVFDQSAFKYDEHTDTFTCPNGATLSRAGKPDQWGLAPYNARQRDCAACPFKSQCTSSSKRTVRRHVRHEDVQQAIKRASSAAARRDLRKRQWLVEGSFAQATRYGLKRARYRGLSNVAIQDALIAAIQNILLLCRCSNRPKARAVALRLPVFHSFSIQPLLSRMAAFIAAATAYLIGMLRSACPESPYALSNPA